MNSLSQNGKFDIEIDIKIFNLPVFRESDDVHIELPENIFNVYYYKIKNDILKEIRDNIFVCDLFLFVLQGDNFSSLATITEIRDLTRKPIIILVKNYSEAVAVTLFRIGADEVLDASIGMHDLEIRISNMVKRQNRHAPRDIETPSVAIADFLFLNIRNRAVLHEVFTPYELMALSLLVRNADKILSRSDMASAIKGRAVGYNDRSIDNLMSRIRKKLRTLGLEKYKIRSFNSVGYHFISGGENFIADLDNALQTQIYAGMKPRDAEAASSGADW
jgi:DNA-binding response OmpR family regulator